ncbi:phosphotransferase enzyme family protein [Oceaniglobus ichthyenteri]|uniref:phosphotransferase enzyme family protein n=1 Tax=Oceaniglobus ichthyenteri TaxID=2136177 RepID=UPI000D37D6FC|nr:phosphotransferase [Oceaniglobus ichthyenteri]
MTNEEAIALARNALTHWGGGRVERLIANRENAVFEVQMSGTRAALRLHRAGYQTDGAIRSELVWTDYLAQSGFPCPRPIPTQEGTLMGEPAFGPRASVVSWIDAPPIGAMERTNPQPVSEQCETYHALGKMLARLHEISDDWDLPPDFERFSWSIDALTGATPLWGPFWNNPALTGPESALLQEARSAARSALLAKSWNTGLIHADVLQENVLGTAGHLHLIDFDDGGIGLRLYDLGTAMVQHFDLPHGHDLGAALCDGYGGGHGDLALFTMLRGLASCGWIIPRVPHDDPRQRAYGERALKLARAYLG